MDFNKKISPVSVGAPSTFKFFKQKTQFLQNVKSVYETIIGIFHYGNGAIKKEALC